MTPTSQLPDNASNFFDDELDKLFHKRFSYSATPLPAVNVSESDKGFTVEMAAPGLDKKDFNIELNDDLLIISTEKKEEKEVKEKSRILKKEFSYHSFTRTFHLPEDIIDRDKISAKYENGILTLEIPKKEEKKAKPSRNIRIS